MNVKTERRAPMGHLVRAFIASVVLGMGWAGHETAEAHDASECPAARHAETGGDASAGDGERADEAMWRRCAGLPSRFGATDWIDCINETSYRAARRAWLDGATLEDVTCGAEIERAPELYELELNASEKEEARFWKERAAADKCVKVHCTTRAESEALNTACRVFLWDRAKKLVNLLGG